MYGWGPSDTSKWVNPKGYNFDSAKAPYLEELKDKADKKGERTYFKKSAPDLKLVDPNGKELYSDSKNPIILVVDGTASMQKWPKEIHDRTPLFYQTLFNYRSDLEVSLAVIGDATIDKWPLQVSAFGKGPILDDYINGLFPEGGGGPGTRESYELAAYYFNLHVKTPNAKKPFMFFMGDEKFYDKIKADHVNKIIGDGIQEDLDSLVVWKDLASKFDLYLLRKQYNGHDEEIVPQWNEAIGKEKVIPVYEPLRVVDIAMGIVAKDWGKFSDFEKNLGARQDKKGVDSVMASLRFAPETSNVAIKGSVKLTGEK